MSLDASFVVLEPTHPSLRADYVPGAAPSSAHNWSGAGLCVRGAYFVDRYGRACNLRGVNLSGNCKTPTNHDNFRFPAEPGVATFVGRPFPLEDAPEHFARLRRWGLTFVRFLVTWEALAPTSPTAFATDYLAYLRAVLALLPQFGLTAFVSLHQDVWSRYSGGSGAPAWTLTAVGFDLGALEQTSAAWLEGVKGGGHVEEERGRWPVGYQRLAASTMATCFWAADTFAPKLRVPDPKGKTGSVGVQQMLQDAFLDAWEVLVRTVADLDGVLGFEMMNEPHRGYVELQSFNEFDYNTDLHLGEIPSALASFALGTGHPARVPYYSRSFPMPTKLTHYVDLDPKERSVWLPDGPSKGQCPWEMHGVWGWDRHKNQAVVLRESYFVKHPQTGRKVDWYTDFYFPFLKRWADRVRSVPGAENKIIFVEAIPNEFCPRSWTKEHQLDDMVYAPHWYDLHALFLKAFGNVSVNVQGLSRGMSILNALYWGHKSARDNFAMQLGTIAEEARASLGARPVIIGECGVPMDMNQKEAFRTGDFTWQLRMMDAMITGLERSLLGFTLWNYNPDNDDVRGDDWCGENFSWFGNAHRRMSLRLNDVSKEGVGNNISKVGGGNNVSAAGAALALRQTNAALALKQTNAALDDGGRILRAVVRPYPAKVAGVPTRWTYELNTGRVEFEWEVRAGGGGGGGEVRARETEVFFPVFLLEGGREVVVEGMGRGRGGSGGEDKGQTGWGGMGWRYDRERQTLFLVAEPGTGKGKKMRVRIRVEPPLEPLFEMPTVWQRYGMWFVGAVAALGVVVIAVMMAWGRK